MTAQVGAAVRHDHHTGAAQLVVGDEAYCLLFDVVGKRSRSGARRELRGAATVRIEAIEGDVHRVVTVRASSGIPGERLELARTSLYATRGEESRAFIELVSWYWPPAAQVGSYTPPTPAPPRHPIVVAREAEQQGQRRGKRGRR